MNKFLILSAALILSSCNMFGERWQHSKVYCLDGDAVDKGPVEATLSIDNVSNERFLNYRDELGRPQRVNISKGSNWICAAKEGGNV